MKIVDNVAHKLYLGASKIPGAGVGLFCGADILAGDPVCEYKGEVFDLDDPNTGKKLAEKYSYTLALGFDKPITLYGIKHAHLNVLVDAQPALTKEETGLGAYANDLAGWQKRLDDEEYFALFYDYQKKKNQSVEDENFSEIMKIDREFWLAAGYNLRFWPVTSEPKILMMALRDVKAGEELYVDYGHNYWQPFMRKVLADREKEKSEDPDEGKEENPPESSAKTLDATLTADTDMPSENE